MQNYRLIFFIFLNIRNISDTFDLAVRVPRLSMQCSILNKWRLYLLFCSFIKHCSSLFSTVQATFYFNNSIDITSFKLTFQSIYDREVWHVCLRNKHSLTFDKIGLQLSCCNFEHIDGQITKLYYEIKAILNNIYTTIWYLNSGNDFCIRFYWLKRLCICRYSENGMFRTTINCKLQLTFFPSKLKWVKLRKMVDLAAATIFQMQFLFEG